MKKFLNLFVSPRLCDFLLEGSNVTPQCKVSNAIDSWCGLYTIDLYEHSYTESVFEEQGLDFSVNMKDKIAYRTLDRYMKFKDEGFGPDAVYSSTCARAVMKPGKLIKKLITQIEETKGINFNLTNNDYEYFTNRFKVAYAKEFDENQRFQLVFGGAIRDAYHEDNYSRISHHLGSSCMRYEECQDYLDIYVKNRDKVGCLVLFDGENKVKARAIVWRADGDKIIMDRVYGINDSVDMAMEEYALSQDWYIRKDNAYGYFKNRHGQYLRSNQEVTLKHFRFDTYPYMDSFWYLDQRYGKVSQRDGDVTLDRTDGYIDEPMVCECCGFTSTDEEEFVTNYNGDTLCHNCSVWSEYENDYLWENEAVYSNQLGDYLHQDNAVFSNVDNDYLPTDDSTEVETNQGTDYVHSDNAVFSNLQGEYLYIGHSIEVETDDGPDYVLASKMEEYQDDILTGKEEEMADTTASAS